MKVTAAFAASILAVALAAPSGFAAAGGTTPAPVSPPVYSNSAPPFLTVPAETEASMVLLSGIHTKISHVDDVVEGQLIQPVYVDGQLALPSGTLLYGRVKHIRPAGRLHRPAELGLLFDEIWLPNGESEPVTARLAALQNSGGLRLDREGYLRAGRQISWNLITGTLLGAGALTAIPKIAGMTAAASAGSIGAAGFLGYFVLFPHGREIHLPPETRCRVRFDYAFTVHGRS